MSILSFISNYLWRILVRIRNNIIFKIILLSLSFTPAIALFSIIDISRAMGSASSLFLLPLLIGAVLWGTAGGVFAALASNILMLSLTWLRFPQSITKSLIIPNLILLFLGFIVGRIFSLQNALKKEHLLLAGKEKRWNTLFESLPDGVIIIDPDTHKILDMNPAAELLIGRNKAELVGLECFSHVCTTEKGKCPITDLGLTVDRSERNLITASGDSIPVLKSVSRCRINDEEVLIESLSDLRALKEAENKLEASRKQHDYLFEELPVPVFRTDKEGVLLSFNEAFSSLLEIDHSAATALQAIDFFKNSIEKEYFIRKLGSEGFIKNLQISITDCRGKESKVLVSAHIIQTAEGREVVEGSLMDITAIIELEEKQRQMVSLENRSRHLDSITRLAAGMAHDINNILAGIHGHAQVIELKNEDSTLQKSVSRITSGVEKADTILQGLMTSIGTFELNITNSNLVALLSGCVDDFRAEIKEEIKLKFFSLHNDVTVRIDEGMICEVVKELLKNSINASDKGGEIIVIVSKECGKAYLYNFFEDNTSDCACVSVIDKGHGIKDELVERIFEPYFTTEDFGNGAGVGLSKVYGIINKHRGAIEIDSKISKGTSVNIYLPLAD